MASWTDKPLGLNDFTPYVQQLPVEAMLNVGVEKQRRYDEGIQRIQHQIDQVAGIDVIKPIHKQYLQSKLNELGTDLKKVAAGDFSNYQLTNSVGGMITKIAKDPTIQSAAYSTQVIRKEQQRIEAARQKGETSIQNEEYWNYQLNSWLEDGDPRSRFNGRYIDYIDIDSKLRELAKDIPEVESVQDIPLMRDNSGNIMYFDNAGNITTPDKGRPRTDAAMLRMSTKGKSAQKILDNFLSSLDPNDIQQLKINGWYSYRGMTKEGLKQDVINNYESSKKRLSDRVVDLTVELKSNPNLTNGEKNEYQAEITRYNQSLKNGELESQMRQQISEIDNAVDFEAYKTNIYMQKYLGNLSNAMAYESVKQTYETNPYWQADMQMKNLNLQYERLRKEDERFRLNYSLKLRELAQKDAELLLPTVPNIPTETEGITTSIPGVNIEQAKQEIDGLQEQLLRFRNEHGEKIIPNYRDLTEEQRSKAFSELSKNYNIKPSNNLDNNTRAALDQYRRLEMETLKKQNKLSSVLEKSKIYDDQIKEVIRDKEPLVLYNGAVQFSAEDVSKVLSAKDRYTDSSSGNLGVIGGTKPTKFDKNAFLREFKGTRLEPIAIALDEQGTPNEVERKIFSYAQFLKRDLDNSPEINNLLSEKSQFESTELAKLMPETQSVIGSLNMKDKAIEARVNNLLNNINIVASQEGLDLSEGESYDPDELFNWRSKPGKEELGYTVRKRGDGTGSLIITKGKEQQVIPLNQEQFSNYFPELAIQNPATSIVGDIATSPSKTTNTLGITGGSEGAISAFYTGQDLPTLLYNTPLASTIRFDIEGAYWNNGDPKTDGFQIRMYVYDDKTKQWKEDIINKEGHIKADAIYPTLSQIGTKKVSEILNK